MRKHWLAVLSIFGLAGSSTPASAQVPKGAKTADTKSESTMKKSKLSQEDAASKDVRRDKWKAQSAEGGQTSGASAAEMRKAGGDPQAQQADYLKSAKNKAELKASQGSAEYKGQKATTENTAVSVESDSKHKMQKATATGAHGSGGGAGKGPELYLKGEKNASEHNAVQQEATIKLTKGQQKKDVNQATPK